MFERHEREEHPDGHDEEEHGDGQPDEPRHAPHGEDGRKPFAELTPQVGRPFRTLGLGNADQLQRRAGEERSGHVEHEDGAHPRERDEQRSERRAGDVRHGADDLIDAGDAGELRAGGQQRNGGLHGGPVEGRAGRTAGQQQVDVPRAGHAQPEEQGQQQRAEGDERVGGNHRPLAVPAVDVGADEDAQNRLGQHAADGGQRQHLGRAGLDAQPENHGISDNRTAEHRQKLSAPDDGECLFPALFHAQRRVGARSLFRPIAAPGSIQPLNYAKFAESAPSDPSELALPVARPPSE